MGQLWPGGPWELPLTVRVDQTAYVLPVVEPPKLMSWLAHGKWWELFPGLLGPAEFLAVHARMYDKHDPFDYQHMFRVGSEALGRLAGMGVGSAGGSAAYWPAFRIAGTALAQWPVYSAWCAARGADPMAGALWQQVALAYGWVRESSGDLARTEQDVWAPQPNASRALARMAPDEVPEHILAEERSLSAAIMAETLPGE